MYDNFGNNDTIPNYGIKYFRHVISPVNSNINSHINL